MRRLVTGLLLVALGACGRTSSGSGHAAGPTTAARTSTIASATSAPQTSSPATHASPGGTPPVPLLTEGYVPLYPFATLAEAQAWQASYREGGHQPWHLDAGQTAIAFTSGYLGFTEIDRVTSTAFRANGAHIGVGYSAGRLSATAAVVHLMRFGIDAAAPWEVVGTDDTTLTLDRPAYGAHVRSPLAVGGVISGVDENVVVAVHVLGRTAPIGSSPGVPAGGDRSPWASVVSFVAPPDVALTVVAWSGGHVQQVERFAVTGVLS